MKNKAYLMIDALVIVAIVSTMVYMVFYTSRLCDNYHKQKEEFYEKSSSNDDEW